MNRFFTQGKAHHPGKNASTTLAAMYAPCCGAWHTCCSSCSQLCSSWCTEDALKSP